MQYRFLLSKMGATAALALVATIGLVQGASAAKLRTLHSFCEYSYGSYCYDGGGPYSPLVLDEAGDLFGVAPGGAQQGGIVFALLRQPDKKKLKYKILYIFCANDCAEGVDPQGGLIIDAAGNLYGVTTGGGQHAAGTVFKLTRSQDGTRWRHSILYDFCSGPKGGCASGAEPITSLTYAGAETGAPYDGVSALYGGTKAGGKYYNGAVYSLQPGENGKWNATPLYAFCKDTACPDGWVVNSVIPDGTGNLLGATYYGGNGGQFGAGVVFRLSPSASAKMWDETILYRFCAQPNCTDGRYPLGLVTDGFGNLFGTAFEGGTGCGSSGCGVAYEIASDGTESTIYTFCSKKSCTDGADPEGPLLIDGSGSLLGVTREGGEFNKGMVFALTGGILQRLYSFCKESNCTDGAAPSAGLTMDASGNLFGVTAAGGAFNSGGTVFKLRR